MRWGYACDPPNASFPLLSGVLCGGPLDIKNKYLRLSPRVRDNAGTFRGAMPGGGARVPLRGGTGCRLEGAARIDVRLFSFSRNPYVSALSSPGKGRLKAANEGKGASLRFLHA